MVLCPGFSGGIALGLRAASRTCNDVTDSAAVFLTLKTVSSPESKAESLWTDRFFLGQLFFVALLAHVDTRIKLGHFD